MTNLWCLADKPDLSLGWAYLHTEDNLRTAYKNLGYARGPIREALIRTDQADPGIKAVEARYLRFRRLPKPGTERVAGLWATNASDIMVVSGDVTRGHWDQPQWSLEPLADSVADMEAFKNSRVFTALAALEEQLFANVHGKRFGQIAENQN